MKLWTWQGIGFDLINTPYDAERARYSRTQGIMNAYKLLAAHLGCSPGDLVFCFVSRDDYEKSPAHDEDEWVLEVPDDRVILLDSNVWCRICGERAVTSGLYDQWRSSAAEEDDYEAALARIEEEYYSRPAPPGGWLSELFLSGLNPDAQAVLIRPLDEEWIVSQPSR